MFYYFFLIFKAIKIYGFLEHVVEFYDEPNIISSWDGMWKNTYCVIEYNCFFKDKNGVYQYHTGKDKLEKLSYNPQFFDGKGLLKLK